MELNERQLAGGQEVTATMAKAKESNVKTSTKAVVREKSRMVLLSEIIREGFVQDTCSSPWSNAATRRLQSPIL